MGSNMSRGIYHQLEYQDRPDAVLDGKEQPTITFGGGGIFFFWQQGVLQYLRKHHNLEQVHFVGASAGNQEEQKRRTILQERWTLDPHIKRKAMRFAGALSATVAACNIDPQIAVDTAYRISEEADLFNKRLGLLGIWGGLIKQWLEEILPPDAHVISQGRLQIVVQEVWRWRPVCFENFRSREDLISANMASIHIPFFLNFRPLTYHMQAYEQLLSQQGRSLVLKHSSDLDLVFSRLDMLKARGLDYVLDLMYSGRKFAAKFDAAGGFDPFLKSSRKAFGR